MAGIKQNATEDDRSDTSPVSPVPLNGNKEEESRSKSVIEEDVTPVIDISPLKAYVQVILVFYCVCFANLQFYMISSLQTSLEGVLGSVTTGLQYFFWSTGSFLTRNVQSILGLKVTFVLCTWLTSVYVIGFIYPTWYTLSIGNVAYGLVVGPALSVGSIYANIIACSLAKAKGKDAKQYIGTLQGVISIGGLYSGALLGNFFSSLIILLSEPKNVDAGNGTFSNATSNMCQLESATHSISDRTYYLLIAVAGISSLSANFASFGALSVPGRTFKCMPLLKVWSQTKLSLLHIVKTLFTCKYALVFALSFYTGMDATYVSSMFTKVSLYDCHYIIVLYCIIKAC